MRETVLPDPPTEEELKNPAFRWSMEMNYGGPIQYVCEAEFHDYIQEPWICEPCEHCGAEITGVDSYPPEEQMIGLLSNVILRGSYFIVHPCGHVLTDFTLFDLSKKRG